MKIVRLTLATVVTMVVVSISAYGQNTQADKGVEASQQAVSCQAGCSGCARGTCNHAYRARCPIGKCMDGSCHICSKVCPRHGRDCRHGCLTNQYGYGRMEVCPGKTNGICPVHGYGACPHQRQPFGPALRQAFTPADRPYFGDQPLYVPREHYDPGFEPRFPRIRALFVTPPPRYMTTAPPEPMPTYTTRGPRDFLNPNPPSIGY